MHQNLSDTIFDLEYFYELSPDLLCVAGYDGYFKKVNPSVSKTLQYSNEELFSRPINSFIHPDDQSITHQKRESIKRDIPLVNFENRYITKNKEVVWLSWTSMPIKRDKLVFAIAKNITYKKKLYELWRISDSLSISAERKEIRSEEQTIVYQEFDVAEKLSDMSPASEPFTADKIWLQEFENIVRKYIGRIDLSLDLICNELAVSERALFRRVNRTVGITPNRLIRIIRLQVALEAIRTGKYRTVSEVSSMAGFNTPAYFSKIFAQVYGIDVLKLLRP
jgi:PAS domain S-box-containing protein